MDKIRILYIIDTIRDLTAGTERQLIQLINNLDRGRFEPQLLTLRSSKFLNSNNLSFPARNLNMKSVLSWSGLHGTGLLKRFIYENNLHIVQTQFPDSNVVGVLAARMAGCRIIISTRRNTGFSYSHPILMATRFANRRATHFIANSERVAEAAIHREKIPPARLSVIYNGLDPERFKLSREEIDQARTFLAVGPQQKLVGIVANLRPVKDLPTFIRAAAIIADKRRDVRFAIIGGGEAQYVESLKVLARQQALGERLCFLGSVTNPLPFIKCFDVAVLTSISEGLSNSLMEYGALGIPAVATEIGGNPEIIRDNSTGLLVPIKQPERAAEAVLTILNDEEWRLKMGREARQLIWSRFNLSLSVKLYQALYARLYDQAVCD